MKEVLGGMCHQKMAQGKSYSQETTQKRDKTPPIKPEHHGTSGCGKETQDVKRGTSKNRIQSKEGNLLVHFMGSQATDMWDISPHGTLDSK